MAASTTLLADAKTMSTTTPGAVSTANAIAAAGPITDLLGMLALAPVKAKEYKTFLTQLQAVIDPTTDATLYNLVTNDILTFS